MTYAEARDFTRGFAVRCEFPDDYDGEEDGGVWAEAWDSLAAQVVAAAVEVIKRHPAWKVLPANRARPATDEVMLAVERILDRPGAWARAKKNRRDAGRPFCRYSFPRPPAIWAAQATVY